MATTTIDREGIEHALDRKTATIIAASSVGTVFEWYDFFLYGSLAAFIAKHFFAGVNETTGFILALLAFSAGFFVRPFGALLFGRMGDLWGRKGTFLVTLILMGTATFIVGVLPDAAKIGPAAAWILVGMRMLQGLAVGGVYGGAATYVAEHAPHDKRGLYTGFIQIASTVGLVLSLLAVLVVRSIVGEEKFADWGWRIPFLLSVTLLLATIVIQRVLDESPVYQQLKAEGKSSKNPWADSFGNLRNLKFVTVALFGAVMGQAVLWYTGQFYLLFFVERVLHVDGATTNILVGLGLLIATPLFIVFGWLSDKIGRKTVMMTGLALACLTYFPLFHMVTQAANPDLAHAYATAPVTVTADPKDCTWQFDPVGGATFSSSCDIAKSFLAKGGINYDNIAAPAGTAASIKVGDKTLVAFNGKALSAGDLKTQRAAWEKQAAGLLKDAGYPTKADPAKLNKPMVVLLAVLMMSFGCMTYGPIASYLVELFPTNIRYTSLSLPYHIGNGWFGGFLPATAFAIVAATGNIYSGLWYPIVIAGVTLVVGLLFMKETKGVDIHHT